MMMIILVATGCPSPTSSTDPVTPDNPDIPVKVIPVEGIKFESSNIDVKAGEEVQLVYNLTPENTTEKKVTWTVEDDTIAEISEQGIVTAKKVGSTILYATTENGKFQTACGIKVTPPFLVLFQTTSVLGPNLGSRNGADTQLNMMAPDNVSNIHAFISVSADDEIRDMPANYGYAEDLPIMALNSKGEVYLIADNWSDLMDGDIKVSLEEAGFSTDKAETWYSQSNENGEFIDDGTIWTRNMRTGYFLRSNKNWINLISIGPDEELYFLGIGNADTSFNYNPQNKVTVSFDINNGTGTTPKNIIYTPGQHLLVPPPGDLHREGYALTGWNTSRDGSGISFGPVPKTDGPDKDTVLYAQWENAFVTTWDTRLVDKTNTRIYLPLREDDSADYIINWGDGTWYHVRGKNLEEDHNYETPGIYTISIAGGDNHFYFGYKYGYGYLGRSANNITTLNYWGPNKIKNMVYMFGGATNLKVEATDMPNLDDITSLTGTFNECRVLVEIPGLDKWNVSAISDISRMFQGCWKFNQDISGWDITNAHKMDYILQACMEFSTANYNKLLTEWSKQTLIPNVKFNADRCKYSASAAAARQILVDNGWQITDAGQAD